MKFNLKVLFVKIIVAAVIITLASIFVEDNWAQLVGAACGFLASMIFSDVLMTVLILREDKNKIHGGKFDYDKATYLHEFTVSGKKTSIWYLPLTNDATLKYHVVDDPKKYFVLDNFLQINFTLIMKAHRHSQLANPCMIRLDDCIVQEDGTVNLYTSRTSYYNDLVTNRAMDYQFSDDLTVRKVYEGDNFLSPLNESRMSNHIGIIGHVFHGNNAILACRGGNATISKNKFTNCIAVGLAENDVEAVQNAHRHHPQMQTEDLLEGCVLYYLADRINLPRDMVLALHAEGKIKIHLLGLGQLVYTGGKPQFYFVITIDESVDLSALNSRKVDMKALDSNKYMAVASHIALKNEDGYVLDLTCPGRKRHLFGEAEKSFFIALWHLKTQPKIEGVPDWAYED